MDVANFPLLTGDEFVEACHHLDSQYCRATLGALRSQWKLRLHVSTTLEFNIYGIPTTYVEITRPLEARPTFEDLESELAKFSISDTSHAGIEALEADQEMIDHEESDEAVLKKQPVLGNSGFVTYEIHLHPTYQMPCLWFRLWNLPEDESSLDIDTVFRRLVPNEYKDGLRRYGAVGGISIDHHPITGSPCFFVHPCLAGDNMAGFENSRETYLTLWLGLAGGCVGLWVPKEMVAQ